MFEATKQWPQVINAYHALWACLISLVKKLSLSRFFDLLFDFSGEIKKSFTAFG